MVGGTALNQVWLFIVAPLVAARLLHCCTEPSIRTIKRRDAALTVAS